MEDNNQSQNPLKPIDWHFLEFFITFILILTVVLGGFLVYEKYFSASARSARETQQNYEKYLNWEKQYSEAMTADTYGGKTPQQTLNMFIEALKKGDAGLASKYFILNEEGKVDQKWIDGLNKTKEAGELTNVANKLSKAIPAGSVMEGYFGFETRDARGELISDINMKLNKFSNVWKIESL
ncbi:MAG: hypothetical protein WC705_02815 [Candidatus Paceibacterota bacterium]|jgi:hypothetical protein